MAHPTANSMSRSRFDLWAFLLGDTKLVNETGYDLEHAYNIFSNTGILYAWLSRMQVDDVLRVAECEDDAPDVDGVSFDGRDVSCI